MLRSASSSLFCSLFFSLLTGCAGANPRNYYFSAVGDDASGDGSLSRPFGSIDKANTLAFNPGDQLLFRGGDTFAGNLLLDDRDAGTREQPVVIGSYGSGRARIEAGEGVGISVHDAGGVTVRDLVVFGAGRGLNWGAGVAFFNDRPFGTKFDDVTVERVDASGFQFEGILVRGMSSDGSRGGYRRVRIVDCKSHHNLHTGIFVTGWWKKGADDYANEDVYIARCQTSDNSGDPDEPDENRSGSGIFVESVDGCVIEHCVAAGNGRLCAGLRGGPVGIWASIARHVTLQNNLARDNHSAGHFDGGGFCFDGGVVDSVLQYNVSENNDGSGYAVFAFDGSPPTQRDVVRWNRSTDDGRRNGYAGIHLWSAGNGIREIEISHNTVALTPAAPVQPRCVWIESPLRDVSLHDNHFIVSEAKLVAVEAVKGQRNVVFASNSYGPGASAPAVVWEGAILAATPVWERTTQAASSRR